MTAKLLDGKAVASALKQSLKSELSTQIQLGRKRPVLAVILVGEDPASEVYVKNKIKACAEIGIESQQHKLPNTVSQETLRKLINDLNENAAVSGILIQLPLPPHIHTDAILLEISAKKDVDGFHPLNMGKLAQGCPELRPCTPYGVMQLLDYYDLSVRGKHAVIVGSSNIVGRPMALELLNEKATVTVCHRQTQHLDKHVRNADIVIVAIGNPSIIQAEWLQPHHIVIDIGIHRRDDGTIHGDIPYDKAKERVAWITPVPGGIGPMTVFTLMKNTVKSAQKNA